MSLADVLERAAEALPDLADTIRPANGDPDRLLDSLAAADARTLLGWLLAESPAAGEELAMAWADSPRGSEPIGALSDESLGKAGRKALRRARHRLRSRGVAVAEAAPTPRVASLPRLDDELAAALVSTPDPSGAQLVVIVEASPAGGARIFQGGADLERGVPDFQVFATTRSQARGLLRDLEANPQLGAVRTSRESLAALLATAAAAQPPGRALPPAFEEWRSRVARPAAGARCPGAEARDALGASGDLTAARSVAERVAAGEIGPWPPALEALREIGEKVRQAASSPLLVDEAQRREHVEAVVAEALDARYAEPAGERTAQRFEETAYVAWRRERLDEAHALLAAAQAFRDRAPRDNPVARALLERVLEPVLEALREERDRSPVVRP
ncbi:hypothetical protein KJ059_17660 [Myxococcota bacterium]|nr:hypothetical protein [Myxococcota bacterium]